MIFPLEALYDDGRSMFFRLGWRRISTLALRWVMSKQADLHDGSRVGTSRRIGQEEGYRTCVLSSSKCGFRNSPTRLVEASCCALPFEPLTRYRRK